VKAVRRTLEYIRAGDIYQANLAHQYTAELHDEWHSDEGIARLWERCVQKSPSPFAALIRHPEWNVLSTSPERFFLLEPNGTVETRPIKGTRPRGVNPRHDFALEEELRASEKDLAELTMIVDLERNDLGRVCDYGSVRVHQHAEVETYSNVHHLVSSVRGTLKSGADVTDVLTAMFPGGSITGAPKIRAMQIIDELEASRRGIYTGAIGYISDHGRADLNIAIRTLVIEGKHVHYHVGGGIVADSVPEAEWDETIAKGSKLQAILTDDE
jgi:aminodeoxychorismate synthase component I